MTPPNIPAPWRTFFEAALPAGADLLFIDATATPPDPDRVAAIVPLAPAPGSPRLALSVTGSAPAPEVVAALGDIAALAQHALPAAPVPPDVGRLLYVLALARRARRALDVGTSAGAAALWLAAAMVVTGGRLTTVERDAARWGLARRHFRRAGLDGRIDARLGAMARLAPRLEGPFDLVFLDEDPSDRLDDAAAVLPRCAPGALVVSYGGVGRRGELTAFDAWIRLHPRARATLRLPVGAGMTLALLD